MALKEPESQPAVAHLSSRPPVSGIVYLMKSLFSQRVKKSSKTEKPVERKTIDPIPADHAPLYIANIPSVLYTFYIVSM